MKIGSLISGLGATALGGLVATMAAAQDGINDLARIGKPVEGGIGFQPAVTPVAEELHFLDGMVLIIITLIVVFVTGLIAYAVFKFRASNGHAPATFTHNSSIEVAWTVIPIIILITIGSFSLPTLFRQLEVPEPDLTIKITGYQWFWSYEYPDDGIIFDAYMLAEDDLEDYGYLPDEHLLATDNAVVVPVGATVKLLITGGDVIHSWKIPAFGVMQDAVPGRLAESWFRADQEGLYFGQCSELCGKDHSYMPIVVKVVSEEQYAAWHDYAMEEFAAVPRDVTVAAAD